MAVRRHRSIQVELPLVIGALWLAAVVVLASIAYAYVRRAARVAAAERLVSVSDQLSGLLQSNAASMTAAAGKVAGAPALRRYLEATEAREDAMLLAAPPATAEALAALGAARTPGDRVAAMELRGQSGNRVLSSGPDASLLDTIDIRSFLPSDTSAGAAAVGPFVVVGDSLALPVVAAVSAGRQRVGYVVEWLYIRSSARERDAMLSLIGPESGLFIGSPDAGTWTDLMRAVPRPAGSVRQWKGVTAYRRGGSSRLAVARAVATTPWYVVVELSADRIDAPARAFLTRALAVGLGVLLLGLIGVWLLTRRITGRLVRLTDAAESINAGEGRVGSDLRGDELVRLGAAFDRMATRVRDTHRQLEANVAQLQTAREQFAHTQRMEAVGRLAGGVAHDFNNLLTVILGEVELALAQPGLDPVGESALQEIRRAGERAALLTQQLLSFSRRQVVAPAEIDVKELVTELEKMLARLIGENVRLRTATSPGDAWIRADRGQMEQVLVNLVVNARDAMPAGGTIAIETARAGDSVVISVTDTGTGMGDEVRRHLFEPFFTTKERGKGSGLGLATSYGIVRQAGGHIEVRTAVGTGTTMEVILPAVPPGARAPAAQVGMAPSGHETVLIVEDEPGVQRIAARVLGLKGYAVLTAASAEEALGLLRDRHRSIDLLLTDVVLQGMGGRELAEAAAALRPGLRVLFVSGYTDDVVLQHRLVADDVHFLAKPYSPDALVQRVRQVLDIAAA
jgi:signal transduction histidine kinase/ActR/RegA family two-component response regulator